MPDRPRVLALAEAASPERVSVPLIGWSLAHALREVADVHLVTQVRGTAEILRAGYVEGEDFTAIDSEAIARPAWWIARRLGASSGVGWTIHQASSSLTYPYFERLVWRRFGEEIRRGAYDVVHRITPVSPTSPSPIARKVAGAGVPFVLGPLNGGVPWPPGFDAERRNEREWLSYVRGAYKALPGRGAMLRNSAAILAGSRHTAGELPPSCQDRTIWLPENGIDTRRFDPEAPRQPRPCDGVLRACFVGRLVPYKGPDLALEAALPLLRAGRMSLDIVGGGPLGDALAARVGEENLADRVTFHGWLSHGDVKAVLGRADVLAFPSIREFGGGVVLEAMALGTVPLVVDYAGPGELVTPHTGVALPLGTRAEIVQHLQDALERFAGDPGALQPLSDAGRDTIRRRYTWSAKAAQIAQVYDWVLKKRATRPRFDLAD